MKHTLMFHFVLATLCPLLLLPLIVNRDLIFFLGRAVPDIDYDIVYTVLFYNLVFLVVGLVVNRVTNRLDKFHKRSRLDRHYKINKNSKFYFIISLICYLLIITCMAVLGIGVPGIPPPDLPFKLTGILMYLRFPIFPLLLLLISSRIGKPSLTLAVLVILVAAYATLVSESKLVALSSSLPLTFLVRSRLKAVCLIVCLVVLAFVVRGGGNSLTIDFNNIVQLLWVVVTRLQFFSEFYLALESNCNYTKGLEILFNQGYNEFSNCVFNIDIQRINLLAKLSLGYTLGTTSRIYAFSGGNILIFTSTAFVYLFIAISSTKLLFFSAVQKWSKGFQPNNFILLVHFVIALQNYNFIAMSLLFVLFSNALKSVKGPNRG